MTRALRRRLVKLELEASLGGGDLLENGLGVVTEVVVAQTAGGHMDGLSGTGALT